MLEGSLAHGQVEDARGVGQGISLFKRILQLLSAEYVTVLSLLLRMFELIEM